MLMLNIPNMQRAKLDYFMLHVMSMINIKRILLFLLFSKHMIANMNLNVKDNI